MIDYVRYRKACRVANKHITETWRQFYTDCITATADDTRRRWAAIRDVLHTTNSEPPRSIEDSEKLCNSCATFSSNKTINLKTVISARSSTDPLSHHKVNAGPLLSDLASPSVDEVAKLISLMPNKSSLWTLFQHQSSNHVLKSLCL